MSAGNRKINYLQYSFNASKIMGFLSPKLYPKLRSAQIFSKSFLGIVTLSLEAKMVTSLF